MHHMESSLHLRMFSGSPSESVWSSVSGMCRGTPVGQQVLSRALVFENVNLSVCFQRKGGGCGESFLALSAGPQQMANWTSTMRPSGAILMLHMLHPAAMTSWRLLSHSPSQPSPWLHNPNCGEQTSALTNTNRHQYENPFQARNHHMHSKTFQTYYQAVFYQPSTFW